MPMPRETASAAARTIPGTEWAITPSVAAASQSLDIDPAFAPLTLLIAPPSAARFLPAVLVRPHL